MSAEVARAGRNDGSSDGLITAKKLSAGYGSKLVIRDVDLDVRAGEVVALLGANGAGKTTTLLTLAGEIRPASGEVVWNGSPRWAPLHRRARQGLAFIPEDRSVFGRLSTNQNLLVKRESDPDSALEVFPQLVPLLQRPARLLSGGEQRMLATGRAISRGARLLLADELSLGLAPMMAEAIFRAIRRRVDQGLGALIVEQHVHRVLSIADRVYVMERGRVRLAATAKEALSQLAEIQSLYLSGSPGFDETTTQGGDPGIDRASPATSDAWSPRSRR